MGKGMNAKKDAGAEKKDTALKDVINKAHHSAVKKAKGYVPEDHVVTIIQNVVAVAQKEKSPVDAAREIGENYKKAGQEYVKAFAGAMVDESLQRANGEAMRNLAGPVFSSQLVRCGEDVGIAIHGYFVGDMDEDELINQLGHSGIIQIGQEILKVVKEDGLPEVAIKVPEISVNIPEVAVTPEMAVMLAAPIIGYLGCMGAYKEMKKALAEQAMAREERLKIEGECSEIIDLIRKYRAEMEEGVAQYLSRHLQIFNDGFAAMDRAILENDTDGFIKGNVEIQAILGYDVQFSNQQEFDALMDSDCAFKL